MKSLSLLLKLTTDTKNKTNISPIVRCGKDLNNLNIHACILTYLHVYGGRLSNHIVAKLMSNQQVKENLQKKKHKVKKYTVKLNIVILKYYTLIKRNKREGATTYNYNEP